MIKRRPHPAPSLVVMSARVVAGKVVLVPAHGAADVALEGVLVAMATHVYGVQDVIRELDVTVLALVRGRRILGRAGGGGRRRHAGLTEERALAAAAAVVEPAPRPLLPPPAARAVAPAAGRVGVLLLGAAGRLRAVDGHGQRRARRLLDEDGLHVVLAGQPVQGAGALGPLGQGGQLAGQRGQLVQGAVGGGQAVGAPSAATTAAAAAAVAAALVRFDDGRGLVLAADADAQVGPRGVVRQTARVVGPGPQQRRRTAVVAEQPSAEAQGGGPLLQDAEHPLVGEGRAHAAHGQQLVAAAAVVGEVAAVAAAEGTEVALVGLLPRVGAHVGLQVALIGRGEGAQLTPMWLFS